MADFASTQGVLLSLAALGAGLGVVINLITAGLDSLRGGGSS